MVSMQADPAGMEGFRRRIAAIERQLHEMRGGARIGEILRGRTIQFQDPDGSINVLIGDGFTRFYDSSGTLNAIIGGGASQFYNSDGTLNARIGDGKAQFYDEGDDTSVLGEFPGFYWDTDTAAWVGGTVRGIALFRPGDVWPFFTAGHHLGADRMDITAGYGTGGRLDSIDIQAEHFAVRTAAGDARLSLNPAGSGNVILEANGSSDSVFLGNNNSGVTITGDAAGGGEFRVFNLGTHATPANLSVSSNVVRVVSSAKKYKADIRPIEVDRDELLSLSGHTYLDKREVADYERQLAQGVDPPRFASEEERQAWTASRKDAPAEQPKPPTRYPGFIADEWAKHETTRQFVRFEDDEPEGFHYDRVTVAHHEVLRDHETRIAELESEKAQMRAEIDELKATVATLLKKPKDK